MGKLRSGADVQGMPVYVYIEDESGKLVEKSRISIKISSLLPGEKADYIDCTGNGKTE